MIRVHHRPGLKFVWMPPKGEVIVGMCTHQGKLVVATQERVIVFDDNGPVASRWRMLLSRVRALLGLA